MRSYRHLAGALAILLALAAMTTPRAQETRFELLLETDSDPSFDTSLRINGEPGEAHEITASLLLSTAGIAETVLGVQGWSLALRHEGLDAIALSVEGTAADTLENGGFFDPEPEHGGFLKFERIDPDRNEGLNGVIQAVVLAGLRPITLPPNSTQVVGRVVYRALLTDPGRAAFLGYQDGLTGSGQPVANVITIQGTSFGPSLASRRIALGADVSFESGACDDGVDNDEDGAIDCEDEDCEMSPACGGSEDCSDGIDNDGNGEIDCADLSCRGRAECGRPEICVDGLDNDEDGDIDCADADCVTHATCRVPEDCSDGIDNDLDQRVDCEDSECRGVGDCPALEECTDGVDNDLDGRVDCDDTECAGVGNCPAPEDCFDEIDNDQDGEIDCDDTDCERFSVCRSPLEICDDGEDNDLDGRVDCDDTECAHQGDCPPLELCTGGEDEDGDGLVDCEDPSCEGRSPCGPGGFDLVLHAPGADRITLPAAGRVAGVESPLELNVMEGTIGEDLAITAFVVPFPGPQPHGAQGWSLSVEHDETFLSILGAPTIEGTDAGVLISGGFERSEIAQDPNPIRPADGAIAGGEAAGFISAVVLSFTQPLALDPTRAQSVVRAIYTVTPAAPAEGLAAGAVAITAEELGGVSFRDGLRGSGQPVDTVLTVRGESVRPRRFVPLAIRRVDAFIRGDTNDDGRVNLADVIWMVNELFRGGPSRGCPRAGDANEDGQYNLSDAMYSAYALFQLGPAIPPPYPDCGGPRAPTDLECPAGSRRGCAAN